MALTEEQTRRYARHILLPDVGGRGQERLLAARVTVEVGPGRDAAVAALAYLAAAGVGTLALAGDAAGAVTEDEVRGGILFGAADVGASRIEVLRRRIGEMNPDVTVELARHPNPPPNGAKASVALDLDPAAPSPSSGVTSALIDGGAAAVRVLAALTRGEAA